MCLREGGKHNPIYVSFFVSVCVYAYIYIEICVCDQKRIIYIWKGHMM